MEKQEIINRVLREYDIKQGIAEQRKKEETKKAYLQCAELSDIDNEINNLGLENMRKIMREPQNAKELKKKFEEQLKTLTSKRALIIKKNKINPDYNKPFYECKLCKDTGFGSDGKKCVCFEKRLVEINYEESNFSTLTDDADFSNFSLDYYSPVSTGNDGISPKSIVEMAVNASKDFIKNFDSISYNLFFYGTTGLGKTFLSSIIAKNVMNMGKTVKYARATKLFSLYDDYKFKDNVKKSEIDEFYGCDLLVIDDLGSEFITKNSVSFLFDLISDRLINNKKIIINTNINIPSFSENYTVRLMSRIYENFKIFGFEGEDIRIRKLMEK